MKDVLSFGEPLVGFYPTRGSSIIDDGPIIKTWGGDTSNLALGIARLGHSVSYLTKVGDDPFGTAFIRLWQTNGVDTSFVTIDRNRRTGLYFVSFEEGVHKLTYYRSNSAASSITVDCIEANSLKNYRVLHLSGISIGMSDTALETGIHLVKLANQGNTKVSFDVNYRAAQWESVQSAEKAIVQIIDNGVDLLEITDDEMGALGWGKSISDLASRFPRCETIIRKEGADGATVFSKGKKYHFPAISVQVKDTVGAGDSFDAGFIVALLEGKSIQAAGKFATATAALTCTGTGPLERMPTKEQVNTLLASL
ncbi:MAG: sugar kinase [Sphaerochaeta sp.]